MRGSFIRRVFSRRSDSHLSPSCVEKRQRALSLSARSLKAAEEPLSEDCGRYPLEQVSQLLAQGVHALGRNVSFEKAMKRGVSFEAFHFIFMYFSKVLNDAFLLKACRHDDRHDMPSVGVFCTAWYSRGIRVDAFLHVTLP